MKEPMRPPVGMQGPFYIAPRLASKTAPAKPKSRTLTQEQRDARNARRRAKYRTDADKSKVNDGEAMNIGSRLDASVNGGARI